MQIAAVLRILGLFLMLFSLTMLPPIIVTSIYHDGSPTPFFLAFLMTLFSGLMLWLCFRQYRQELKIRDGFAFVCLFWLVLSLFASIPLMLADKPHDNFTDAIFETVSGFTTTGATVVHGVEFLSHAMRYYRQQLQFLGGMGIVVLAVAILPILGVGGMQLYRAETPGPMKDSKLKPRVTETSKALWYIYLGLTVACALSYYLAGMMPFDALGEAFATVSTGGFAMHDTSFAYYQSSTIEMIAMFFMLLGGVNFSLHFMTLRGRTLRHYWYDEELRHYVFMLMMVSSLVAGILWQYDVYHGDFRLTLVKSFFNVISLATTTGYISGPFHEWPSFVPALILFVAMVGGCAGSTAGGIKFIRALLLKKQSAREINRLIHPHAVFNIKFGKQSLPDDVLQSMWSFIAAFISLFVILIIAFMATNLPFFEAFGVAVATLSNSGAAVGSVATNFSALSVTAKWIAIIGMLAGRLEIFTLLVLFSPTFWRA